MSAKFSESVGLGIDVVRGDCWDIVVELA